MFELVGLKHEDKEELIRAKEVLIQIGHLTGLCVMMNKVVEQHRRELASTGRWESELDWKSKMAYLGQFEQEQAKH